MPGSASDAAHNFLRLNAIGLSHLLFVVGSNRDVNIEQWCMLLRAIDIHITDGS